MHVKKIIALALVSLFFINTCLAQEIPRVFPKEGIKGFKKKAAVVVNGDKVEYLQAEKRIEGVGNISITYGDVKLTCDKITVHTDTKLGICEGNVKITQPGAMFTGEKVIYNFGEQTGEVIDGYVRADPIYARAEKVEKVSEKKIVMQDGYATTCNFEKPHYRIAAKQVRLYLEDKVIANHVFFYIGNVPILYVPYYVQPLRDTKTKITIIPGYEDNWGYYALGSYRYYFNEQLKGYLRLDYRHKRGLAAGVDYSYDFKELGEGTARYYYTQENNGLALSPSGEVADRYRFQYKHTIHFPEDTMGIVELNKVSDTDMVKDYFFNEIEEGWTPDNFVSVVTKKPNYSLEILARKRLDKFFTVTERLPELNLQVYNQRLWDTNFYYFNNASVTNLRKRYAESQIFDDEKTIRVHTYNKLSYMTKILGFLFTTPYVATRQTYYSENKWGDPDIFREVYEYGLDLSTKFYKVFDIVTDFMDINRLRHIINPIVGFRHRTQPTVSPSNLNQFDSIDSLDYENLIALSLENKLQTKRKDGEGWKSVDLVRFIISTDYLYRFKKGNLDFQGGGKFSDIRYELEIRPYDWLFIKTDITTNMKDYSLRDAVKSANTDIIYDLGEKFSFGMGHRFENSVDGSTSLFTMEMDYKINDEWAFRVYERFDTYDRHWEEQEYTIYKDLHCWTAEFTCNFKDDNFAFWVVFRLKAFPDVPIGLKRTYRRPSPGATI